MMREIIIAFLLFLMGNILLLKQNLYISFQFDML